MDEIWAHVPEKYGNYEVSNMGRLRHAESKTVCKLFVNNSNGYYQRSNHIGKKKRKMATIHRVVAETFIPNPNNLPQVNHKNGNKLDNRVENLEWCTEMQNTNHALSKGLCKNQTIVYQFTYKGVLIKEWGSITEASSTLNISKSGISDCCSSKQITAGGYRWSYKNPAKHHYVQGGRNYKCKKVYVYDSNYNLIHTFDSLNKASLSLNIPKSSISIACRSNGIKTAKGFRFSFKKLKSAQP